MKQKDIVLIIVVIIISGGFSLLISSFLFKTPKLQETQVEVVQPITADFVQPDVRYFNANSIDPTQNITIGSDQNTAPFNDNTQ